jgi:chemotaxis regulatin CheY-phosphate phosphatase CheZ
MPRTTSGWDARKARHEVTRLLQRIRTLTRELRELEQRGITGPVVEAKERLVEQLRWRLATVVRESGAVA